MSGARLYALEACGGHSSPYPPPQPQPPQRPLNLRFERFQVIEVGSVAISSQGDYL